MSRISGNMGKGAFAACLLAATLSTPAFATVPRSASAAPSATATGWTITVYYTPVEAYFDGSAQKVTGCADPDCTHGKVSLGEFPKDFVTTIETEGVGRISSGSYRGKYLTYDTTTGFYIDTAARDAEGNPLVAFRTAAADPRALKANSRFVITACGTDSGSQPDPTVCKKLKSPVWKVTDEFISPTYGGVRHVDLYVGEQNTKDFDSSPFYIMYEKAALTILK